MTVRHFSKHATVLLALVVGMTSSGLSNAGPEPPSPFPSEEEARRSGFAIWPEDTIEEGRAACLEHADDQPWRLSATKTAKRFARDVLDHEKPYIGFEQTEVEEHHAEVWLYAKEVFLSNIVQLRRADVCWFITEGYPREDSGGMSPVFTQDGEEVTVHFQHYTRTSREFDEVGFGTESKTFEAGERPYRRSWILPPGTDEEGHVLHLGWDKGGAETVTGEKVPPPPEVGGGEQVFPVGERFTWSQIDPDERKKTCRRSQWSAGSARRVLNDVLQWQFDQAMPSGPYPDVLKVGRKGSIGKHVYIAKKDEGTWRVRIFDVVYRVVIAKATDDCWSLDKIDAVKKPRPLQEVFYDDTAATMDFRWQNSGKVLLSIAYGYAGGGATLHSGMPSRVTFYRSEDDHGTAPGLLFVTLLKKGEYVNAFSRRLPPRS